MDEVILESATSVLAATTDPVEEYKQSLSGTGGGQTLRLEEWYLDEWAYVLIEVSNCRT